MNVITQYITEHKDYIHVETAELVLTCLYKLGHHPPEGERFFLACTSAFSELVHLGEIFCIVWYSMIIGVL